MLAVLRPKATHHPCRPRLQQMGLHRSAGGNSTTRCVWIVIGQFGRAQNGDRSHHWPSAPNFLRKLNVIHSDHPIPDEARAYIDSIPKGSWYLFDMSPLDVTGIPAWKAAFFPRDSGVAKCEMQQGTGYGITAHQAIISAVAECYEEIQARIGFARLAQFEGSYDQLVYDRGRNGIVDPFELCLPAGSDVQRDTILHWVEARRWLSSEPVLVPVDVVAISTDQLPPAYRPFTTLITNGLGAGPTVEWAAAHGLFECLQRDGNGLKLRAMDAKVGLTFDDALPPDVASLRDQIEEANIDLLPKFVSDEFGLVNVFVVGADRNPARLSVPIAMSGCGEAVDVDRVAALRKAILEYAHSRARKALAFGSSEAISRVMPAGYWERVEPRVRRAANSTEPRQIVAFRQWLQLDGHEMRDLLTDPVFTISSERPFDELVTSTAIEPSVKGAEVAGRLIAAGLDPLIVDFSLPGASMHAVRVIVPKLEVETMSYYRIGERNSQKLIALDSPLIRWGQPTKTHRRISLSPEAYQRLGGIPLLDVEAVDAKVGALYPLYREPGAHEMMFHVIDA